MKSLFLCVFGGGWVDVCYVEVRRQPKELVLTLQFAGGRASCLAKAVPGQLTHGLPGILLSLPCILPAEQRHCRHLLPWLLMLIQQVFYPLNHRSQSGLPVSKQQPSIYGVGPGWSWCSSALHVWWMVHRCGTSEFCAPEGRLVAPEQWNM